MMQPLIDWPAWERRLGTFPFGGNQVAQLALADLIGEENLRGAVDLYARGPLEGSELARSVLMHLRPAVARHRCIEIFRSAEAIEQRRNAVELFRALAIEEDLPLVAEFLADSDETIQNWGIGVLDQLTWQGHVGEQQAEPYLAQGGSHPNAHVRKQCEQIRQTLRRRA